MFRLHCDIEKYMEDRWRGMGVFLDRNDVPIAIAQILRVKVGKSMGFDLIGRNDGDAVRVSCENGCFVLTATADDLQLRLNENHSEVLLSFLLDMTDEWIGYDHVDMEIPCAVGKIDLTVGVKK